MAKMPGIRGVNVILSSQVANYFSETEVKEIEKRTQRKIKIKKNPNMHVENYKISSWI